MGWKTIEFLGKLDPTVKIIDVVKSRNSPSIVEF